MSTITPAKSTQTLIPFAAPINYSEKVSSFEKYGILRGAREMFSPFYVTQYHVNYKTKDLSSEGKPPSRLYAIEQADPRGFFSESIKTFMWLGAIFTIGSFIAGRFTPQANLLKQFSKTIRVISYLNAAGMTLVAIAATIHSISNTIYTHDRIPFTSKEEEEQAKAKVLEAFAAIKNKRVQKESARLEAKANSSFLQEGDETSIRQAEDARQALQRQTLDLLDRTDIDTRVGGLLRLADGTQAWMSKKVHRDGRVEMLLKDLQGKMLGHSFVGIDEEEQRIDIRDLEISNMHPKVMSPQGNFNSSFATDLALQLARGAIKQGIRAGISAAKSDDSPVVNFIGQAGQFMVDTLQNDPRLKGHTVSQVSPSSRAMYSSSPDTTISPEQQLTGMAVQLGARAVGGLLDKLFA